MGWESHLSLVIMEQYVSKSLIIELLTKSVNNKKLFKEFEDFVLLYYLGDIEYIFESKDVENFFTIISSYLETERISKKDRNMFLVRLRDALIKYNDWSEEFLIVIRNYEEIKNLIQKFDEDIISFDLLTSQIRKYCYMRNDVDNVVFWYRKLYNQL